MTDDELERRLRAHYRDLDPGTAPARLSVRVADGLESQATHPGAPVRLRPAFGAALAAVAVVAIGLGLAFRPGGFLGPAAPTPTPTSAPTSAASPSPSKGSPAPSSTPDPSVQAATVDAAGTFPGGGLWAMRGSTLFVSTDAGTSWHPGTSSIPAGILAASVLDPTHAWVVTIGAGSTLPTGSQTDVLHLVVGRSTDRGQSWQQAAIPGSYPGTTQSLVFADAQHGYLLCSALRQSYGVSTVLRTVDGGISWSVAGTKAWLGSMFAASDATTLWAGAEQEAGPNTHPILDVSRDGGRTWQDARLPGLVGAVGGAIRWLPGPPIFVDPTTGFVIVASADAAGPTQSRIYGTTDSGHTWTLLADPSAQASAGPAILDAGHWLLPTVNPPGLQATADGGASWQDVPTTGLSNGGWMVWIGAIDTTHVVALVPTANSYPGPAALYLSADAGRSWQPADLTATAAAHPSPGATPPPLATVASVAFFDATHGLAVGATPAGIGAVWRTSDGGHTWAETDLGRPSLGFVTVSAPASAWATVMCPNPAWSGDTCSLIASADGGATWHAVSDRKLLSLSFIDATHGWGVSPSGAQPGAVGSGVLSTADGGRTWSVLPASPCGAIGWPVTVSFVSRLHGWVGCAGMGGAGMSAKSIAETTDGGRAWLMRASAFPPGMGTEVGSISLVDYLDGISMRPSGAGLAWESRGGTLRTADGGRTWVPMPPGSTDAGPVPAGGWAITDRDWVVLLWDPNAQATILYVSHDGGGMWAPVAQVPASP